MEPTIMLEKLTVIKRNGHKIGFDRERIFNAIYKAFLSVTSAEKDVIDYITTQVVDYMAPDSDQVEIKVEYIQDCVQEILMENGHHKVATNFILYREHHKIARQEKVKTLILDRFRKNKH